MKKILSLKGFSLKEISKLNEMKCKHGHSYLSHKNCYLSEIQEGEKIGFLDIECSALKADWGIILTYSILDADSGKVYTRMISKKELYSEDMDKELVRDCIKDMEKFDRLVTYYGDKFDLPFIRTRALKHGLGFPKFGTIRSTDVYPIVKYKLCLSRNRLMNAEQILMKGKTTKTAWLFDYWVRAIQGNQKALEYILDHNIKDVYILRKVYNTLKDYARRGWCSI